MVALAVLDLSDLNPEPGMDVLHGILSRRMALLLN